ncbi:thioesterase [Fusarium denticulatum]|uniref:Thioesterase n=1 Tax=Fusarium denticulatum TaxID=48507 RepID=A0A8H5XAJ5_9HYPO|nr:thioesterase [Fusarium denticulatum]
MFSKQAGHNGRLAAQACKRFARPTQSHSYATGATAAAGGAFKRAAGMLLAGVGASTAGGFGTWYTMHSNGLGFHSDEESLRRFVANHEEAKMVEETINKHPLVAELRANPELTESRPHMKMPGSYRSRSLTGGALIGEGKMPVPPYAWMAPKGKQLVSIAYVGDDLCGHPGIVHGGLLATMLDEGLGRCSFGALPHNIAVTANLNVDYRKPTPAGSFLVLRAETYKVEGRKAWVRGHIELLAEPGEKPTIVAEAQALFISPKYAAMMPKIG